MTPDVSVLIADDQAPFLAVARLVVDATPGFAVAADAANGAEAIERAVETGAQFVLMDINLGADNGIEVTRELLAEAPDTIVVLVSTYTEGDLPSDALECGAVRYVHKEDLSPDVLIDIWAAHH